MRVQINLSNEMVNKVDEFAKKMGVSRSSLCSVLIGNGILGYEKAFQLMDGLEGKMENVLVQE